MFLAGGIFSTTVWHSCTRFWTQLVQYSGSILGCVFKYIGVRAEAVFCPTYLRREDAVLRRDVFASENYCPQFHGHCIRQHSGTFPRHSSPNVKIATKLPHSPILAPFLSRLTGCSVSSPNTALPTTLGQLKAAAHCQHPWQPLPQH